MEPFFRDGKAGISRIILHTLWSTRLKLETAAMASKINDTTREWSALSSGYGGVSW